MTLNEALQVHTPDGTPLALLSVSQAMTLGEILCEATDLDLIEKALGVISAHGITFMREVAH